MDKNGLYGEEFTRYSDGRTEGHYFLNIDLIPTLYNGSIFFNTIYEPGKMLIVSFDENEELEEYWECILDEYNNCISSIIYDKNGNRKTQSFFITDDFLITYYEKRIVIKNGQIIEEIYNDIEKTFFPENTDFELTNITSFKIATAYNTSGWRDSCSYYLNDTPMPSNLYYQKIAITHQDNPVSICNIFSGSKLLRNYKQRNTYDNKGNCIKIEFFDLENNRIKDPINMYDCEIITYEYDLNNRITKASFFSDEITPTVDKNGVSEVHYSYDKQSGNLSKSEMYNEDGLYDALFGYASYEYKYDSNSRISEIIFRDSFGQPHREGAEFSIAKYEYFPEAPNIWTKKYYKNECEDFSLLVEFEKDDIGNIIKEKVYKRKGKRLVFDYCYLRKLTGDDFIPFFFLDKNDKILSRFKMKKFIEKHPELVEKLDNISPYINEP